MTEIEQSTVIYEDDESSKPKRRQSFISKTKLFQKKRLTDEEVRQQVKLEALQRKREKIIKKLQLENPEATFDELDFMLRQQEEDIEYQRKEQEKNNSLHHHQQKLLIKEPPKEIKLTWKEKQLLKAQQQLESSKEKEPKFQINDQQSLQSQIETETQLEVEWQYIEQEGYPPYYWNSVLNISTYENPCDSSFVIPQAPAYEGYEQWSQIYDETSGYYYYWNYVTNETTYDNPYEPTTAESNILSEPINWYRINDKISGIFYYWNNLTNETTYEQPQNFIDYEHPSVDETQQIIDENQLISDESFQYIDDNSEIINPETNIIETINGSHKYPENNYNEYIELINVVTLESTLDEILEEEIHQKTICNEHELFIESTSELITDISTQLLDENIRINSDTNQHQLILEVDTNVPKITENEFEEIIEEDKEYENMNTTKIEINKIEQFIPFDESLNKNNNDLNINSDTTSIVEISVSPSKPKPPPPRPPKATPIELPNTLQLIDPKTIEIKLIPESNESNYSEELTWIEMINDNNEYYYICNFINNKTGKEETKQINKKPKGKLYITIESYIDHNNELQETQVFEEICDNEKEIFYRNVISDMILTERPLGQVIIVQDDYNEETERN